MAFSYSIAAVDGGMDTETLRNTAMNHSEARMLEEYHAANQRAHNIMMAALNSLPDVVNRNGGNFTHDSAEFEVGFF